jgi:hypothetical protein
MIAMLPSQRIKKLFLSAALVLLAGVSVPTAWAASTVEQAASAAYGLIDQKGASIASQEPLEIKVLGSDVADYDVGFVVPNGTLVRAACHQGQGNELYVERPKVGAFHYYPQDEAYESEAPVGAGRVHVLHYVEKDGKAEAYQATLAEGRPGHLGRTAPTEAMAATFRQAGAALTGLCAYGATVRASQAAAALSGPRL